MIVRSSQSRLLTIISVKAASATTGAAAPAAPAAPVAVSAAASAVKLGEKKTKQDAEDDNSAGLGAREISFGETTPAPLDERCALRQHHHLIAKCARGNHHGDADETPEKSGKG
jgi:hypothetical protein